MTFVPYRGGAPAMQDLVSGRVDIMLDQAANALGQVRAGAIKAYAVMAKERWAALPDVPTIDKSGLTGLYVAYWHAMWAPKGTPKDIIAKLNAAVMAALADPDVRQRLRSRATTSGRATSRRRRRSSRTTRPRPRSGGRSSRRPD